MFNIKPYIHLLNAVLHCMLLPNSMLIADLCKDADYTGYPQFFSSPVPEGNL